MDECFLGVGTRIEFYQDGLKGIGTIRKLLPNKKYCYHVQVEWCNDREDETGEDLLYDCNGTVLADVGWMVEHRCVTAVLDQEGDASCDVEDSDLDAILGM